MKSLPFPRRSEGASDRAPSDPRRKRFRWVVLLIVLGALAAAALAWRAQTSAPVLAPTAEAPVVRGDLPLTVESSGVVQPARSTGLTFQAAGQVSEVLVAAGQQVQAGQPIARLDSRDLQLALQQAEADVRAAEARLAAARDGSATPQELDQASAGVRAAEAQLQQSRVETATSLREAEAQLQSAQARLDALRNPSADKTSAARLAVTEAEASLQSTRDGESAAKTGAELEMRKSVEALTTAQTAFETASYNWQQAQAADNPQRRQSYEAFVQAEAALRTAEANLAQAQLAFDSARQQEATSVERAEAQLADARQQLAALLNPSASALQQAQADVAQAQARVERLRGGSAATVAQSQAQVDSSRAALEQLSAPATAPDIAAAEVDLAQAQAQREAARLALDRATLTAPFSGTVATLSLVPGDNVGAGTSVGTLIDTSALVLDLEVSESDVARIETDQPVEVRFDALPDVRLDGQVASIAPAATEGQEVVTYKVRVTFAAGQAAIKPGMSASAAVEVDRRTQVLLIPNRAISRNGPVRSIQVVDPSTGQPVAVDVQLGATDGTLTEIVGCLPSGAQCLRDGDSVLVSTPGDATSAQQGPDTLQGGGPGEGAGAPRMIPIGP